MLINKTMSCMMMIRIFIFLTLCLSFPTKNEATTTEISKQNNAHNVRLVKNRDNGSIIELADGSVWKIANFDTYKTREWHRDDEIEWSKSPYDRKNPYRLYNKTKEEREEEGLSTAFAAMLTPANPTGGKQPENAEEFAGSIRISALRQNGQIVDLENGSSWKILLVDQIRASDWKRGDRIKIERVDYLHYNYALKNLDTGESIRVEEIKK